MHRRPAHAVPPQRANHRSRGRHSRAARRVRAPGPHRRRDQPL